MVKNNCFKRVLLLCLCIVLTAAMVFAMTACNNDKDGDAEKVSFTLTVVDRDGKETTKIIETEEKTVGAALLKKDIIAGENGQYGLYVKTVNGITANDADREYWAFYINGEYAMTGVDSTDITEGATYMLKIEKY